MNELLTKLRASVINRFSISTDETRELAEMALKTLHQVYEKNNVEKKNFNNLMKKVDLPNALRDRKSKSRGTAGFVCYHFTSFRHLLFK